MSQPGIATRVWNLAQSLADFVVDPCVVSREVYQKRLEICQTCDARDNNTCMECGCYLPVKAYGKVWHCPRGLWENGRATT